MKGIESINFERIGHAVKNIKEKKMLVQRHFFCLCMQLWQKEIKKRRENMRKNAKAVKKVGQSKYNFG